MSKIQIVTDSTSYINKSFIEEHDIEVVPLSVHFEDETETEGFVGEFESFFSKLANAKNFPTTSQPPIGSFVKVFEKAIDEEKEIIVLTISSKLSGTYSSASSAAKIVDKDKISVIDSESTAANLKAFVEIALEMIAKGHTRDEIVSRIEEQKKRSSICLTVDTLDYLQKGGRLSNTSAFFANLLNIRPIIALVDGKLEGVSKTRGKKKALEKMIELIHKDAFRISVCHIYALDEAQSVKETIQSRFPNAEVTVDDLGPVVGAHLGPKALGICYLY